MPPSIRFPRVLLLNIAAKDGCGNAAANADKIRLIPERGLPTKQSDGFGELRPRAPSGYRLQMERKFCSLRECNPSTVARV